MGLNFFVKDLSIGKLEFKRDKEKDYFHPLPSMATTDGARPDQSPESATPPGLPHGGRGPSTWTSFC